ncbi:hypothetical protein P12x_001619 [Tundrisphaera lichenicola]|uniref:hypothetical protein n=1 Tax=Tundrisphaera lichenicola TaxID=2029860 RepID=UPI003EBCCC79
MNPAKNPSRNSQKFKAMQATSPSIAVKLNWSDDRSMGSIMNVTRSVEHPPPTNELARCPCQLGRLVKSVGIRG